MATYTGIYFKGIDLNIVIKEFRNSVRKKNWDIVTYSNDYSIYPQDSFLFGVVKDNEDWISIALPEFFIDPLDKNPVISIGTIVDLSEKLNSDCIVFSWQSITDYCYWCYIVNGKIRRLHSDISDDSNIYKNNIGVPFEFENEIKIADKHWIDATDDIRKNALTYDWANDYCKRFGLFIESDFEKCEWHSGID